MKVKVLANFFDKTADLKLREAGEVINVTQKRAEELEAYKVAERVKEKGGDLEVSQEAKG